MQNNNQYDAHELHVRLWYGVVVHYYKGEFRQSLFTEQAQLVVYFAQTITRGKKKKIR